MLTRLLVLLPLAAMAFCASSASAEEMDAEKMAERYLDVQRCIERTIGRQWSQKYGIDLARNQWGAVEATGRSIDTAPQVVRMTDLRCRRELSLTGEPRP